MKKTFGFYSAIWVVCFAVFNLICFVSPRFFGSFDKFDGAFWVGYAFITVAFVGQLACAIVAFRAENLQKMFYNLPLLSISYSGLVAMLVLGSLTMAIPDLPKWIGAIVCILALLFTVISVLRASAAAEIVNDIDKKVKSQTQFIKMLTVDAQNLMERAQTPEERIACKKVYDAVRYSDPMSSDALSIEEHEISEKMLVFADAVQYHGNFSECADELIALIGNRNRKCKALK